MLAVGLTGGIGTGKSICASVFRAIGIPIYESDVEAKRLMISDQELKSELIQAFGEQTYLDSGQLNRSHLAQIVFSDESQLERINQLVHPAVRKDFLSWCQSHQQESYIIQESALVYEIGLHHYFDKVIVVDAPTEMRIQRVMNRDQVDRKAVLARISKQLPQSEKVSKADYVIVNDGNQSTIRQVIAIHHELIELSTTLA